MESDGALRNGLRFHGKSTKEYETREDRILFIGTHRNSTEREIASNFLRCINTVIEKREICRA